ncbi:hypothetical protein BTBSAS_200034 [Brochothrix thermosphacta]|uniref:Uncharacterized protein n=1 Tax=Brochothrix thermosphacta TaxID=2756 RepID=A0A2X0S241_BROTH|nr:hypothetical protein BTBSAS_200034 [Brochothrix thermosphacta]
MLERNKSLFFAFFLALYVFGRNFLFISKSLITIRFLTQRLNRESTTLSSKLLAIESSFIVL